MPTTPNRSYPYPSGTDAATVPAHLQSALINIDADMQGVVDGLNAKVGLEADGTAPAALLAEIRSEVAAGTEGLATEDDITAAIAPFESRVPIFETLAEAEAWEAANPGRQALTTEAPPDPGAWQATAPTFNTVAGTVTIPADEGATYTLNGAARAAGTYSVTVPSTVTVQAIAKPGYTLAGQTEWVRAFEENVTAYETTALGIGVQHYWRMDETSGIPVDRGNGAALSVIMQGSPTYSAAGLGGFQRSIEFAGTAGRMQLQGVPASGTTAYTYAMIFRVITLDANPFSDWSEKNSVKTATGAGQWQGSGPTVARPNLPGYGPQVGTTYHVALTWDGASSRVYVDGALIQTTADAGPITAAAALRVCDVRVAGASARCNGVIVDHTKALTGAQIQALSNAVVR